MVVAVPLGKETAMRRLVLFTFVLLLAAAPSALASRRPSHHTRVQLNAAVRASDEVPPPIQHGRFHLRGARVSTRGPWAKATVIPNGRLARRLDAVLAIFRRHGDRWRLASLGTAEVGCGHPRLSVRVRRDLRLACPVAHGTQAAANAPSRP
jgi:hypothetical protein